jgi:hypothetical protein
VGRTVLPMDCVLAGAERHRGRPLNEIVRSHQMALCPHCQQDAIERRAEYHSSAAKPAICPRCGGRSYSAAVTGRGWFLFASAILLGVAVWLSLTTLAARWTPNAAALLPIVVSMIFAAVYYFVHGKLVGSQPLISTTSEVAARERRLLGLWGTALTVASLFVALITYWRSGAI